MRRSGRARLSELVVGARTDQVRPVVDRRDVPREVPREVAAGGVALGTLPTDHLTATGTNVVVASNVTAVTLGFVIGSAAGFVIVSVLIPGARAAPGLLTTASWRTLRGVDPSIHVTSKATRL